MVNGWSFRLYAFPPLRLFFSFFCLFSFCLLPCSYAQYADSDGDPNDPFQIAEPNQLIYMSLHPEHWGLNFILTADLNMNLADPNTFTTAVIAPDTDNTNYNFEGIPFAGIFDGNGHIIYNLTIDTAGAGNDYLGLFGQIQGSSAEVKNLDQENVSITGGDDSDYLGGLCGWSSVDISNCYVTGSVTSGDRSFCLGGLCGRNQFGSISNCNTTGSVTGGVFSGSLGGLCGFNDNGSIKNSYATSSITGGDGSGSLSGLCGNNKSGSILNCYATGSVIGGDYSTDLGGLCGENIGDISTCYATGSVSGTERLGGLCGRNDRGSISNCYATGSISGHIHLGGLCGRNDRGSISNCYATGSVTGGDDSYHIGGLCGFHGDGIIFNCYATGSVTGGDDSYRIGGLCGLGGSGWSTTIINCYASGSVIGGIDSVYLGGLCGINVCTTINCYATGSVNGGIGSEKLGGLCGYNGDSIRNCYATGSVTGDDDLGGLCGENYYGIITNCYFLDTAGPDNGLGQPLSDPNMRLQSKFVGWDFVGEEDNGTENHWQLCLDGYDYPHLTWQFINPADFLLPGRVDNYDLFVLTHDWLAPDSRCCDIAPVNLPDGIVNLFDYIEFSRYWLNE